MRIFDVQLLLTIASDTTDSLEDRQNVTWMVLPNVIGESSVFLIQLPTCLIHFYTDYTLYLALSKSIRWLLSTTLTKMADLWAVY